MPALVSTISPEHNCEADLSTWESSWSLTKKTWCCNHEGHGCGPSTTIVMFDCFTTFAKFRNGQQSWSGAKRAWCCKHHNRGCVVHSAGDSYDCDDGYKTWRSDWNI